MSRLRSSWRSFYQAVKQMTSRKLRGQREKFWQERYLTATFVAKMLAPK